MITKGRPNAGRQAKTLFRVVQRHFGFWTARPSGKLQNSRGMAAKHSGYARPPPHFRHFAIDGLDECDGQSRGQLLASVKAISENTPSLKLLVSTRPEEVILKQLEGMSKIVMESNPERDRLIAEKIVETRLPDLTDEVKALVIYALSGSAKGSAIWTRMTVELIDKRRITAPDPMRAFLDKMQQPRELWELYANVYSRYTGKDSENHSLGSSRRCQTPSQHAGTWLGCRPWRCRRNDTDGERPFKVGRLQKGHELDPPVRCSGRFC